MTNVGEHHRVATKRRLHRNPTAAKKIKVAQQEIYPVCHSQSRTTRNLHLPSSLPSSKEIKPSFPVSGYPPSVTTHPTPVTTHPTSATKHPTPATTHPTSATAYNNGNISGTGTAPKCSNHPEIHTIQHKKPLFRSITNGSTDEHLPQRPESVGLASSFISLPNGCGPNGDPMESSSSPFVEDDWEEQWILEDELELIFNSETAQPQNGTSPDSSPLPPTPQPVRQLSGNATLSIANRRQHNVDAKKKHVSQSCAVTLNIAGNPEKWFNRVGVKEEGDGNVPGDLEQANKRTDGDITTSSEHRIQSIPLRDGMSDVEAVVKHQNAIDEENSEPFDIDVSELVAAATKDLLKTPRAITTATSRLRQRLQSNARVATPPLSRYTELRRAKVDKALMEIVKEKNGDTDCDIGPFYGLPSRVGDLLKTRRGIKQLYDWQHSCLTLPAVQRGSNLVYSLPTSGGKTLVAEILIMRQLLCNKKDALLVLPYVAIVQEKVASLSTFAVDLGFLVEEYAGSRGSIPPRKRRKKTLYIATIEKGHSLVNSLILDGRIASLGLVVVDEVHMLGDGGRRGASLEACIAKLLHVNTTQIVGMSATLSNIQDLCDFMKAEVYCNDFRPVELKEFIKIEDSVFEVNPTALCPEDKFVHSRVVAFPYTKIMRQHDHDHLVGLALEVIPTHSCLIFCPTKRNCQNVAELICKYFPRDIAHRLARHKSAEKHALLKALHRDCDGHLCPTLKRTVPYGLAYHHGGLTMDERKLVEDAYSDGTLCLLTCTSTLAAGVNLPAKRVILQSPYIAQNFLTSTRYKQMVGRAGRAGIDTSGESILIIKPKDRQKVYDMLGGPVEACYSSLMHDDCKGIRAVVLTLIALKLTTHRGAVTSFMHRTLFGVQAARKNNDVDKLTAEGIEQLLELRLVKEVAPPSQSTTGELTVTELGQAAFKGSIDIDLCDSVYKDLKLASGEGLILVNTLHLLYLVTPYDMVASSNPNWSIYDRVYSKLSEDELRVAETIGLTERYLNFKLSGRSSRKTDEVVEFTVRRFYLTLMLWELLHQSGVWDVAARFEVPRGFIQSLFTSAASFGSSVQRFCENLPEFWAYRQLLTKVVEDLTYCATADLVSLLDVPGVKQGRAKQLVRAGYKTIRHLAHADPEKLTKDVEYLPLGVAQQIIAAAKMELAERVEALREEAEELVSKPDDNIR